MKNRISAGLLSWRFTRARGKGALIGGWSPLFTEELVA